MGGFGIPTLLLVVQLGVGLVAAADLIRSLLRRRFGLWTIGQALVALVLIALGADGLFFQTDLVGRLSFLTDLDPSWARPALVGLILAGTALWMTER